MQYDKGDARRNGHDSVNAMRTKEKEMESNMEQFVQAFQQNANSNTEELNEVKDGQKVFGDLSKQLVEQMKNQQVVIDKLAKRLEESEKKGKENGYEKEKTPRDTTKRDALKHLCPICKQQCFHKEVNCPETNEAKRWPGWTTRL
jgi:ribosomal protein L33